MIPRPLTDEAARHDAGRWVCAKRPERCDGVFWVYGQPMRCPIRAKCFWGRAHTAEWIPPINANRRSEHSRRLMQLVRLFGPPRPPSTPEERERKARWMREYRAKQRTDKPPAPIKRQLLPCGEDCDGGCPYDTCPYGDVEEDALAAAARQELERQRSRDKYRRQKARERIDPEYAAHRKALEAARCKRWYEKNKAVQRAKARERYHKTKTTQKGLMNNDQAGDPEGQL